MRNVFAVIVGYLVFGATAGLLFAVTRRDPHLDQPAVFVVLSIVYGVFFATAGGFVAARTAPRQPRRNAAFVGVIIAVLALVSLTVNLGRGSLWSEIATLGLMAPAAVLGGRFVSTERLEPAA